MHQIPHHVDEGRLHAGVAAVVVVAAQQAPAGGKRVTVAVRGSGLVEDQDHPKHGAKSGRPEEEGLIAAWPNTHRTLTPTAQPEVTSMTGASMS